MRAWLERHERLTLLFLFGIGVFLRLWQFGHVPVSLYWDEMAMWNDALSIVQTGRDLFDRSWFQPLFLSYGDYKLPIYIWFVALVSKILHDPIMAVRVPSLLAGISMIPTVYWLTTSLQKLLTPQKKFSWLPLISSGVLAVLPWSLHFSRVGYEGHLSAAFFLVSIAALAQAFVASRRQGWWILLSSGLGSLAVYTYFSTRFSWPVVVLGLGLLFWNRARRLWPWLLVGALVWVVSLVPMYQADFYDASNTYRLSTSSILNQPDRQTEVNVFRERSGNTLLSRVIYNRTTFLARDLALNYLQYLDPSYLFLTGDPNLRHGTGFTGLMFPSFAPIFVVGLLVLVRRHPWVFLWLAAWWAAAVLPAAIPTDVPHSLRSLNALPVMVLVVAWGSVELLNAWQKITWPRFIRRWVGPVVLSLVFLLICAEILRYQYLFTTLYARESAAQWQDGYMQLAQRLATLRSHYDYVYVDQFDDRFFLYYQPYSELSYDEIQQLPSQDFKRDIFKNVRIRPIDDWLTLERNSAVVTRRGRLPEGWAVKEVFANTFGEEEFVLVETPRI